MQDLPAKEELLFAIARFLEEDVRPQIKDARLNFRVLIATHLAATVANECRVGDAEQTKALERLRALLHVSGEATYAELDARLAKQVREGAGSEDAALYDHVKKTLLAKLAVNSPRFDTRPEIE